MCVGARVGDGVGDDVGAGLGDPELDGTAVGSGVGISVVGDRDVGAHVGPSVHGICSHCCLVVALHGWPAFAQSESETLVSASIQSMTAWLQ